jgi:hypothetical protein
MSIGLDVKVIFSLQAILHDLIYPSVSLELAHMPAAKEATSYTGVNVQSDR